MLIKPHCKLYLCGPPIKVHMKKYEYFILFNEIMTNVTKSLSPDHSSYKGTHIHFNYSLFSICRTKSRTFPTRRNADRSPCRLNSTPLNSRRIFPFLGHENVLRNLGSTRISSKLDFVRRGGRSHLRKNGTSVNHSRMWVMPSRSPIGQRADMVSLSIRLLTHSV